MQYQFVEGGRYSGEIFDGGCGTVDTLSITVLKRSDRTISYVVNHARSLGQTGEAEIKTIDEWGEYIAIGEDRFFAYATHSPLGAIV